MPTTWARAFCTMSPPMRRRSERMSPGWDHWDRISESGSLLTADISRGVLRSGGDWSDSTEGNFRRVNKTGIYRSKRVRDSCHGACHVMWHGLLFNSCHLSLDASD